MLFYLNFWHDRASFVTQSPNLIGLWLVEKCISANLWNFFQVRKANYFVINRWNILKCFDLLKLEMKDVLLIVYSNVEISSTIPSRPSMFPLLSTNCMKCSQLVNIWINVSTVITEIHWHILFPKWLPYKFFSRMWLGKIFLYLKRLYNSFTQKR